MRTMNNNPTQQYLDYLISTHIDAACDVITAAQPLNTLRFNSTATKSPSISVAVTAKSKSCITNSAFSPRAIQSK